MRTALLRVPLSRCYCKPALSAGMREAIKQIGVKSDNEQAHKRLLSKLQVHQLTYDGLRLT